MTNELDTTLLRTAPSRRTVLRTAAHAAWAVPAVQIATSVPAFASASNHAKIDLTLLNSPDSSGTKVKEATLRIRATNNGVSSAPGGATASTVTLIFSGAEFRNVKTATSGGSAVPMTDTTVTLSGLAQGSSVDVDVVVQLLMKEDSPDFRVTVSASATSPDGSTESGGSVITAAFK